MNPRLWVARHECRHIVTAWMAGERVIYASVDEADPCEPKDMDCFEFMEHMSKPHLIGTLLCVRLAGYYTDPPHNWTHWPPTFEEALRFSWEGLDTFLKPEHEDTYNEAVEFVRYTFSQPDVVAVVERMAGVLAFVRTLDERDLEELRATTPWTRQAVDGVTA